MKVKPALTNLALVLISVSVALVVFEFGLIIIDAGQTQQTKVCYGNYDDRKNIFHEEYGWTKPPDSKFLKKHRDKSRYTKYTYNKNGFRDTYNPPSNNSIIILGDSFTEGVLANDNATYPHLLDRWTPNNTVRNFGVGGYGTSNSLLLYKDRGTEINHDVVILTYYYGNDMLDNTNKDPFRPVFKSTNEGIKLERPPVNREIHQKRVVKNKVLRSVIDWFDENTRTYTFLEPRLRSILVDFGFAPEVGGLRRLPNKTELEEQKSVTRGLVKKIGKEANNNNAKLIIVGIPTRGEVRPDRPGRFYHNDSVVYANIQRDLLANVSHAQNNIEFVPLKHNIKSRIESGKQIYGIKNGHMTEYGYRVVTTNVYDHLKGQGLVANSHPDLQRTYVPNKIDC